MKGYFSYLPNIKYVSRTTDRSSNDEFIAVKNLFRRARLRGDLESVATAFNDYIIGEDLRPEQIAQELYGDPRFDWVILIANNIINVRNEWPLSNNDFQKFVLEKYGSEENLAKIHHYKTTPQYDEYRRLVLPQGLKVDSNFDMNYLKLTPTAQMEMSYSGGTLATATNVDVVGTATDASGNVIQNSKVTSVSNYDYEVEVNDAKRRIGVIKPTYLDVIVSDLRKIMSYKRSTQFINRTLKEAYNPRLSGA